MMTGKHEKTPEGEEEMNMDDQKVRTEEFKVQGEQIMAKIKELIRQGNVRRISVKNEEGQTLVDIPLTLSVVGALLLPQFAALAVIIALLGKCRLVVERTQEEI
jgi:hypothetical protein